MPSPSAPTTLLDIARRYLAAGFSVVPVRADGTKKPAAKWEAWQHRAMDERELARWWGGDLVHGIALIHGVISGGSEALDFDAPGAFEEWQQLCDDHGFGDLARTCVTVETPSGGWHLYYRHDGAPEGNQKLAQVATYDAPDGRSDEDLRKAGYRQDGRGGWYRVETKIETRGEGGYTVAPGSPRECHPSGKEYRRLRGQFADLPVLTAEQRGALLAMARAANEYIEADRYHRASAPSAPSERTRNGNGGGHSDGTAARPGDDFNARATEEHVVALLVKHGWAVHGRRGRIVDLTRPGKNPREGMSATLNAVAPGVFYPFTNSAPPFESERAYTPFSVYGLLECGGDFAEAARRLGAEGYGTPPVPGSSGHSGNKFKKLQTPLKGGGGVGKGEGVYSEPPFQSNFLKNLNQSAGGVDGDASDDTEPVEPRRFTPSAPWDEEPRPFGTENLPPFPTEVLPPVLRNLASALAASVGTAEALPGAQLLAGVSAAAQKRVAVLGKPGHVEPLTLWVVSVAPPGSRKTAVVAAVRRPFAQYEARANNEDHRRAIERYLSEERVARKRLDRAEAVASAQLNGESGEVAEDLYNAREAVAKLKPVRPVRVLSDDATPEANAIIMSEQGGRLAVFDAEGTTFGHMTGRYSDKVAIEVYLKSHSGESFTQDRAGKERRSVVVRNAALAIGCAIQPEVLAGIRKKRELTGVGILARCLFSFSDDDEAADEYLSPDVPDVVTADYRRLIDTLLVLPLTGDKDDDGEPLPYFVQLSPDALHRFEEFYRTNRQEAKDDPELLRQWRAKLHGATLRLAGVLHLAEHGVPGAELPISPETMAGAITLAGYFLEHARVALGKVREDEATEGATRILGWVKRNREKAGAPAGVSTGELLRQLRGFDDQDGLNAALALLAARGYVRALVPEPRPSDKRGRKPGDRWQFHPSLMVEPQRRERVAWPEEWAEVAEATVVAIEAGMPGAGRNGHAPLPVGVAADNDADEPEEIR